MKKYICTDQFIGACTLYRFMYRCIDFYLFVLFYSLQTWQIHSNTSEITIKSVIPSEQHKEVGQHQPLTNCAPRYTIQNSLKFTKYIKYKNKLKT